MFRQLVLRQILQLPLQTLALQLQLFALLLRVLQLFTGRLPHGISLFHFLSQAQAACVSVEQIALGGFFIEGLVYVLAVYVDQCFTDVAQLCQGGGLAIDEAAAFAFGIDDAAYAQLGLVFAEQALFRQCGL